MASLSILHDDIAKIENPDEACSSTFFVENFFKLFLHLSNLLSKDSHSPKIIIASSHIYGDSSLLF